MRALTLLFTSTLLLMSCNFNQIDGEAEYALKKMHTEVVEIHDVVMPRLSEIGRLKRQLKEKLEAPNAVKQDSMQQFIYRLDEADNAMMNWMGEFKKPSYEDVKAAEKIYQTEKQKIIAVRDKMNSTISDVELFMSRL